MPGEVGISGKYCKLMSFRCSLRSGAAGESKINIQVEIEVLQVRYNMPADKDQAAIIVLKLCVPRPRTWLKNESK